jgi:hypothetical protein
MSNLTLVPSTAVRGGSRLSIEASTWAALGPPGKLVNSISIWTVTGSLDGFQVASTATASPL